MAQSGPEAVGAVMSAQDVCSWHFADQLDEAV